MKIGGNHLPIYADREVVSIMVIVMTDRAVI
jgi:hypothetical protein